ncbi:MAG: hypothetical protein RL026_135, partial [Pseudomonadota bacterium]
MTRPASCLTTDTGEAVPLQDMQIEACLRGLMAEVSVTQTWHNSGRGAIEGVYTFPLPLDAVLLDFDVRLAGQRLRGRVVPSAEAEETYEEALDAGDSALRLEQVEPGLYTVHVGNLAAGESALFRFRYVLLYRWNDDSLRLSLPTTVAPRYDDSLHGPGALQHSLTVENHFGLQLRIEGELAGARLECVTHSLQQAQEGDALVLSLAQPRAVMDRDLVLTLRAPGVPRAQLLTGSDGAGAAAVASFLPTLPGLRQAQPLDLALVVDCSGSMSGESIDQARVALERVIGSLKATDKATLLRFGSHVEAVFPRTEACTPEVLARLRDTLRVMQADLGGTGMHVALQTAVASGARDLFLITDGEIGHWQELVETLRQTQVRVFSVGVGAAVAEPFLRALSAATGGACELVNPGEQMAARILRHFERLRAPAATDVQVQWPGQPCHAVPTESRSLFEGDTLIAAALFDTPPDGGEVVLSFTTTDGCRHRQALPWVAAQNTDAQTPSDVARLAADQVLRSATPWPDALRTGFAVHYQLVSDVTQMIVVAVRAEQDKQHGIPALQVVPQTLAAGWAGTGVSMLCESSVAYSAACLPPSMEALDDAREPHRIGSTRRFDPDVFMMCERSARNPDDPDATRKW